MFYRYFKALSAGEVVPVKNRLDSNPPTNIDDLTKGQLAVLHKQVNLYSVDVDNHVICGYI